LQRVSTVESIHKNCGYFYDSNPFRRKDNLLNASRCCHNARHESRRRAQAFGCRSRRTPFLGRVAERIVTLRNVKNFEDRKRETVVQLRESLCRRASDCLSGRMKSRGGKDGRTKTGRQFGLCHRIRRIPHESTWKQSCGLLRRSKGDGRNRTSGHNPPRAIASRALF